MLADFGIKLLDLHLARLITLVLGGGVEVSSTGAGDKFDFITHGSMLLGSDFFAAGAYLGQYGVNAPLVDDAHAFGGQAQAHPTVLALDPEPVSMQVGEKTAFGFIVRMGNIVSRYRALAGYLADF
jgi:hypothetical protein